MVYAPEQRKECISIQRNIEKLFKDKLSGKLAPNEDRNKQRKFEKYVVIWCGFIMLSIIASLTAWTIYGKYNKTSDEFASPNNGNGQLKITENVVNNKKIVSDPNISTLNNNVKIEKARPSYASIILISVIFGFSLIAGYINPVSDFYWQSKYYALVFLCFIFPFTMLTAISMALDHISITGNADKTISLGFAKIYHGTYVQDIAPEWIFSFTSPAEPAGLNIQEQLTSGLGAPMWTMFLAVIGSSVNTILLLVKHVTKQINWGFLRNDDKDPKANTNKGNPYERTGEFLRHQFNTLLSPLSAIFVYQFMVAAGAASKSITVGLTMLGAGATITPLLYKAIKAAEKVLNTQESETKGDKIPNDQHS